MPELARTDYCVALSDTGCGTRLAELDALRGIGALAILGYHLWPSAVFFGWTRVDLFFVLSGYLITATILKHGQRPGFLLNFWARRALRIWPTYYMLLAILCAMAAIKGAPLRFDALIAHLTFTQNVAYYWSGIVPWFSSGAVQTWSLAIEEQFYIVWPLVIVIAGRDAVVPMALALMVDSIAARTLGLYPAVALARCDGLALGSLLAAFVDNRECSGRCAAWIRQTLIWGGLAALAFLAYVASRFETSVNGISGCGPLSIFAVNVLYFSLVGMIILHSGHPLLRPLRCRALTYVGQISYGIFLCHLVVAEAVSTYFGALTSSAKVVAVSLSVLVAAVSWEYIERPIARLKRRFRYETGPASTTITSTATAAVTPSASYEGRSSLRSRFLKLLGVSVLAGMGVLIVGSIPNLWMQPVRGFIEHTHINASGHKVKYVVFVPHNYRRGSPCPLIMFLHGSGATGTDGWKPVDEGLGPAIRQREATFPFLTIFPQARWTSWGLGTPDARTALAILAEVEAHYSVDRSRTYLTGYSMGGHGTWSLAAAYPDRWAAIAPVCGWGDAVCATRIKQIPCWCFHGSTDAVVPVSASRIMIETLRAAGGSPRYTEYERVGHSSWELAYDTPGLYSWLLDHRKVLR